MTYRRGAIAAAVAALLFLAGCGSASEMSSGQSSEAAVGDTAGNAPSGELTVGSFASMTSQAQSSAKSAHLELDAKMMGQSVTMSGDMSIGKTLADTALEMNLSAAGLGQDMSLIMVDKAIYISQGGSAGKYFRIELDKGNPLGKVYRQFVGQADPADITRAFEGAIESFDKVGSERIDGTQMTQYRIKVDTRKVLNKTLGDDSIPTGPIAGDLPETMTYDIWVGDQDNLPRRIEYSMSGTSLTMELSDWGEPVHITAPPPSQISKQDPFSSLTPQV
jgi:hypothetical protein